MKILNIIIACLLASGCSSPPSDPYIEHRDTRAIGSADIQRLPDKLTYRQLIRYWGPASAGDPCFTYRSKIDGITLAVFFGDDASSNNEDRSSAVVDWPVLAMYFIDNRSFVIHAWGAKIFPVDDPFSAPATAK